MESIAAVTALSALAQSSRLEIFRYLVQESPNASTPGDLASALSLPKATLSFHLKELTQAGLISAQPSGRRIFYSANIDAMRDLLDYLSENCCQGNNCDLTPAAPRRQPGDIV